MHQDAPPAHARITTPDTIHLIPDPCHEIDGLQHVVLHGVALPILQNGQPVRTFAPGWRATSLFTSLAPLFVLEFGNDAGESGLWILDHRMAFLCNHPAHLSADMQALLRTKTAPLLREIVDSITTNRSTTNRSSSLSKAAQAFLLLQDQSRQLIALASVDVVLANPTVFIADHLEPTGLICAKSVGDELVVLSKDALCAGFAQDWQERVDRSVILGKLSWPSPVDGAELDSHGSLVFDDFHFAYQFVDERYDLFFLVLVGDHRSCVGGVWFPALGIMVVPGSSATALLRSALQHHARDWFIRHVLAWHDEIVGYSTRPKMRFFNVMRMGSYHIGHQLWNELSGIDHLISSNPDASVTHFVAPPPHGLEIFGPIDELFPELQGKVDRTINNKNALAMRAYRSGAIVYRINSDFIASRLRKRIIDHVARDRNIGSVSSPPARTLLIGLRVENRTVIDLEEFCCKLVHLVGQRFPGTEIVFDGHNSQDGVSDQLPIGSHGESIAKAPPHDVELQIVRNVQRRFSDQARCISHTIMQPVSASIAAALRSSCFVSIWGASLAKYRWVANKPGFVLTSRWNLQNRNDLDIYHAPRYMEDPAPMDFLDESLVHDDPTDPQLVAVQVGNPGFANFRLDDRCMTPIQAFLDRHLAGLSDAETRAARAGM